MSVVAVRVYQDHIEVACDSAITYAGRTQLRVRECKMGQFEPDIVIACAGSPDDFALMKYFLETHKPAEPSINAVLEFYMDFKSFAQEKGRDIMPNNESETDYVMTLGGRCFSMEGFHVREIVDFHAFGDGMDLALAALHVGATAEQAVEAACYYNIYCMQPVNVANVPVLVAV